MISIMVDRSTIDGILKMLGNKTGIKWGNGRPVKGCPVSYDAYKYLRLVQYYNETPHLIMTSNRTQCIDGIESDDSIVSCKEFTKVAKALCPLILTRKQASDIMNDFKPAHSYQPYRPLGSKQTTAR